MAFFYDSWRMVTRRVWDDVDRNLDLYEFLVQDTLFVQRRFDAANRPETRQNSNDRQRILNQLDYYRRMLRNYEEFRSRHINEMETTIREATEYGAVFPDVRPTRGSSECLDELGEISENAYDARMEGRRL